MLNRAAVLLKYKAPAINWVNEADPSPESHTLSMEDANAERTVYLISQNDADGPESARSMATGEFREPVRGRARGLVTDSSLWPKERTWRLFHEWFDVECHTVLIDTLGDAIYDDDI